MSPIQAPAVIDLRRAQDGVYRSAELAVRPPATLATYTHAPVPEVTRNEYVPDGWNFGYVMMACAGGFATLGVSSFTYLIAGSWAAYIIATIMAAAVVAAHTYIVEGCRCPLCPKR